MNKRLWGLMIIFLAAAVMCLAASPVLAATQTSQISITAPSAGETLSAGANYTIEFNIHMSAITAGLSYSTDGGSTWQDITSVQFNDTSYDWTVPSVNTTHAMIKVWATTLESSGWGFVQKGYYNTSEEFTISKLLVIPGPITPIDPIDPGILIPFAPTDLDAATVSATAIDLEWEDKSGNENSFIVERQKQGTIGYAKIATLPANTESYSDTGLAPGTKYYYRVYAKNGFGNSAYSNVSSATTFFILIPLHPLAPADLTADPLSSSKIELEWADKSNTEAGFKIERKQSSNAFTQIATVGANVTEYKDTGLDANTTYSYRVKAYNSSGDSDYSNTASAKTESTSSGPVEDSITMRFYINSGDYYVNNQIQTMDTAPIIKDDRTILPIRYVAEPLGADVAWDPVDRRVTISMGSKIIKLWIDNNTANVNGTNVFIDPNNANVKPIIIPPGRTMLPLRFIAESLGCDVSWNAGLQEVTVTYN